VLSIEPYEDEWLIVGTDVNGRIRWCRLKESTRDKPRWRVLESFPAGPREQTIAYQDGTFGILVARTNQTAPLYRNLTLYTIAPEGTVYSYRLLVNESVPPTSFAPLTGTVAKEGDAWIVGYRWVDFEQREHLKLWRAGRKTESILVENASGQSAPALVSGSTHNLLLVRQRRSGSPYNWDDLYAYVFARGTFDSAAQPPALLSWSDPWQATPTAVSGAHGVFAAWFENDSRLVTRFLDADGTATTPAAISSPAWQARAAAVARNGDTFIVAWQEVARGSANDQKVLIARFDGRGNPLDTEPLVLQRLATGSNTGVSIASEGDGFRVAWVGRMLPDAFGRDADQVVFTTHIPARGESIGEPEPLVPGKAADLATRPLVVSNGNDAIVLFTQGGEIAEMHYAGGAAVKNFPSLLGVAATTVAAAANNDELLLATVRSSADGKTHCTWAQRLSFGGVKLAPAVELECNAAFPSHTSVVWDRNRWWITSSTSPASVHALHADGTVAGLTEIFPATTQPRLPSFFASAEGTSAVYVRSDASTDFIERAFLRTFPRPKARAARP
jgi:hypothetical protein